MGMFIKKLSQGQSSGLPVEYQEVEYLESNGTQYIDLGFKPNQTTKAICKFNYQPKLTTHAYGIVFGSRVKYNDNQFDAWDYSDVQGTSGIRVDYANGNNIYSSDMGGTTGILTVGQDYTYELGHAYFKCLELGINNYQFPNSAIYQDDFECPGNLYLFCLNNNGSSQWFSDLRIKSFYAEHNGSVIRNLIPCYRILDSTPGMYDLVNNQFYTNANTLGNDFIVGPNVSPYELVQVASGFVYSPRILDNTVTFKVDGEDYQVVSVKSGDMISPPVHQPEKTGSVFNGWILQGESSQTSFPYTPTGDTCFTARFASTSSPPVGYQEVEYLEADGTQYIETNHGFDSRVSYSIEVKFGFNTDTRGILFSNYKGLDFNIDLEIAANRVFRMYYASYGADSSVTTGCQLREMIDATVTYNSTTRTVSCNCNGIGRSFVVNDSYSKLYIHNTRLLTDLSGRFKVGMLGRMRIKNPYDSHYYIPCYRISDSEPGVYDLVTDEFLTNSGTGTFIVGPDVN